MNLVTGDFNPRLLLLAFFLGFVAPVQGQTLSGGIPLGGIGTGTVRLHPNGSFGQATLTNNRAFPVRTLNGCFAALWTRSENRTQAIVLSSSNGYALPAVSALTYEGLFPQAKLAYRIAAPVSIAMTAFSPLIPYDLRNSTHPAAAFVFHLKNTADQPTEISIAFSWENFMGVGGTKHTGAFADRTGNSVQNLPDSEGVFGLRLSSLPVPARSSAQRFRDNAAGEMALVCLPPRGQAQVTSGGWNALDTRPSWWDGFAAEGTIAGSLSAGDEGRVHPAGIIAVKLILRAKESLDLPFVVAWNTPHFGTESGVDLGHFYQTTAQNAAQTAQHLVREWRALHALTEEWQNRILFSNLPRPAARRVINALAPLTANTLYTRDGRLVFFSEAEGYGGTSATLTESHAIFPMLLAFFPRLAVQYLRQCAALQAPSGLLPASLGDPEMALDVPSETTALPPHPNTTEPPHTPEVLQANAAFLTDMALFVQQTGDREFLKTFYPQLKRCADALKRENAPQDALLRQAFAEMGELARNMGDNETAHTFLSSAAATGHTVPSPSLAKERVMTFPDADRLMSESTLWLVSAGDSNLINELSGLKWDALNGHLTFACDIPGTWRNFSAPLFLPSVWGKWDYKPTARGGTTTLRIERLIPLPPSLPEKPAAGRAELLVKQWTVPNAPPRSDPPLSVFVGLGQNTVGYTLRPLPNDLMSLLFDMAVRLNAGDRLEATLR